MMALYFPLREHMIGLERQNVAVSNLSTNVVLMLGMWGWINQALYTKIYQRVKKDSTAKPPLWHTWVSLSVGWLAIILWMSAWGMPLRF